MNATKLMTLIKASTIAIACAAMLTPASATTVYKTIGKYGEVKYSQFPPRDAQEVEVIELRNNRPITPGDMNGKTNTDVAEQAEAKPATPEEQKIAELEKTLEEQKAQEKAQRCQTLRNNLNNLSTGGRVYIPDDNGNKKYLDDRETELERERVQKLINSYCTGSST